MAVALSLNADGGYGRVANSTVRPLFADIRQWCDERLALAVGVDMPIGMAVDGVRQSDALARKLLGPRRASLFPTPAHAVLEAESWEEALTANHKASGKGISKQAFNLMPKVRQVRGAIQPSDQPRFSEVHPETSLAVMAQLAGWPPLGPKKTALGVDQRREILAQHIGGSLVEQASSANAPVVDVLDALAAAWTAGRMVAGSARILGDGLDPDGYALTLTV